MSEKSTPSTRFDGFTNDWEQHKLGELASFSRGFGFSKSDLQSTGTPVLLYGSLYTNYRLLIDSVDTFAKPIPGAVFSQGNEVIIPASDVTSSGIARASAIIRQGIMLGGDINVVRPTNSLSSVFLALVLSHGRTQRALLKRAKGTSVVHLHNSDIQDVSINYPSSIEQMKLGGFFRQLDSIIALCRRKLDLLTQAKKALMQQIFSQKLRFKADDGSDYPAWEEKKLGDITDNYDSLRVPVTQSERTPGDVPYYGANGIQDYVSGFTHEGEFVLLPEDGASDTKHYPAWVIQSKAWVNNHAHVLRGKEDLLDNFFLAYRITTMDISKYLVGGGRAKLNAETLTSLKLVIPSLPEQKKIASCLSSADALIAQARAELEQWREVKKSLLQQMFV